VTRAAILRITWGPLPQHRRNSVAATAVAPTVGALSGAPGRGEPGTGELPLGSALEQLLAGGYRGYVGVEYMPTRADTFDWLPRAERGAHSLRVESLPRHTGMGIQ
jgi:hydroxypyruvate isomerase